MEQTDEPEKGTSCPELLESNFTFYDFTDVAGNMTFTCQIMKMQDSYFVYIGNPDDGLMNTLSYSFLSAYDNMPVDIRLMGPVGDRRTPQIAKKLAKLTGNPIYVSFDTRTYGQFGTAVEEKVIERFKTHVLNCAEQ